MKQGRQKQILDLLMRQQTVKISELVERFSVSIETVRRDLSDMEKAGLLTKTYGGAVLAAAPRGLTEVADWRERQSLAAREKELIARRAVEHIPDGCVLALEVGTTMFALARPLAARKNLTILTNDLIVAEALWRSRCGRVFLVGGQMGSSGYYTCGDLSVDFVERFAVIDILLISTEGLSLEGLSTPNGEVNALKKYYLQRAGKIIALCDHTKFGHKAIFHTCPLQKLDLLITDAKAPAKMLREIRKLGVAVELAEP